MIALLICEVIVAETQQTNGIEVLETREWLDSLDYVLSQGGPERAGRLLQQLAFARAALCWAEPAIHGDYSLPEYDLLKGPAAVSRKSGNGAPHQEPGALERDGYGRPRQQNSGRHWRTHFHVCVGGNAYEVAFNHFFHAATETGDRDVVYFQGHAAPGIYARAYLEGRLSKEKLENFRREMKPAAGSLPIHIPG